MPAARKQETLSAVELLLAYLEAEGVTHVFGIPGGPLMPLYEALFARGRMRPVLTKHEEGAAFMADGYARVSGRLGVCCATTGPGATNALTGIACARRDSVPVMLLTAQIATHAFGKGAAQESSPLGIDVVDLYKSVTKASHMLVSPEKMAEMARLLLRTALSGRPGPVHLNLPADMVKRRVPADVRAPAQYRRSSHPFDRESIKEASRLILAARRPAILAGYGVQISHAHLELMNLAERLAMPVATTPRAKGVFPENHPLSLGVLGLAGSPQADAVLLSEETDLLIVAGSSLAEASTHAWDARLARGKRLIQIDIDPIEIGRNYPVDTALIGDARHVLLELAYQVSRDSAAQGSAPPVEERREALARIKATVGRCLDPRAAESEATPLSPARTVAELRRALPDDAILFVDIGNVMAWALHYYEARRPGTFMINMGFGSMGHAVAAAVGGKLAAPDRPVVALVGDAAFAMNGMEVHTAVEHDVPVVWVVHNNGGHGMVHLGETLQFKGRFNTSLFKHPLDVAAMAEAMGARAFRAERPGEVQDAVARALESGKPCVVDVRIDPEAMPPTGIRIETLERFFNPQEA